MTTGKNLQPRRKGVILLLVLAVMAMFAMLMATFMVVSSQQYREADSVQKLDRYVHSPEDDLHTTIVQMLVGSNSRNSGIRVRGIADTIYGDANTPGLTGTTSYNQTFGADGELHRFFLNYPNSPGPDSIVDLMINAGNVFTAQNLVTKKWHSARIAQVGQSGSNYYVDVRGFSEVYDLTAFDGGTFYINPPAYSGMGVGFELADNDDANPNFWKSFYGQPQLRLYDTADDMPFADQMNPNAPSSTGTQFADFFDDYVWSSNVDYTAPDAASPFLGWFDMQFNGGVFDPTASVIIPSYHRPSLVAYYGPTDPDTLRKLVVRPLSFDHPEFDGTNTPLATTNIADLVAYLSDTHGRYLDVDTDGDGIKDAVWVDVGLPVRTDLNGRTYKPLVAIKCIDLDGRLNLNAIGNLAEAVIGSTEKVGSGFGPAGINLSLGLFASSLDVNEDTLFTLDHNNEPKNFENMVTELLRQRYFGVGGEMIPRDDTNIALTNSIINQFGFSTMLNSKPLYDSFGNLPDYWDQGMLQFDPLGNRYNNMNHSNMLFVPYSLTAGAAGGYWAFPTTDAYVTNPYMFDPNRRTPYDQPFSLPELEAVLRQGDLDKDVLPERLREILGFGRNTDGLPVEPELLKVSAYHTTTLSNDVPVPGPALADQGYRSLYELIRSCVEKEYCRYNNLDLSNLAGWTDTQKANMHNAVTPITLQLIKFLPDEIKQGGKINLNKLVEDPSMFLYDLTSNATAYERALYERMKMARGIYIILMALSYDKLYGAWDFTNADYLVEPYIEPSYLEVDAIKDLKSTNADEYYRVCRELATTRLAQWSINVVEFTDADAVMTPFIFDVNPFDADGWGARGINDAWGLYSGTNQEFACIGAHADYRLIWGMERPDLLLTETMAFHNRNVADTSSGGYLLQTNHWKTPISDGPESNYTDTSLDQIRAPEATAMLELVCAADPNRPNYPQELYQGNQLDIGKYVNDSREMSIKRPVWQIAFSGSNTEKDHDNSIAYRFKKYGAAFSLQPYNTCVLGPGTPTSVTDMNKDITVDRYVWFSNLNPLTMVHTSYLPADEADRIFYNRMPNDDANCAFYLLPNQYLVVGPRAVTHLSSLDKTIAAKFGKPAGPKIDLRKLTTGSIANAEFIVPEEYGIGQPRIMIAATDPPATWIDTARTAWLGDTGQFGYPSGIDILGIGLNVSAPLRTNYYTEPTQANSDIVKYDGSTTIIDAYGALNSDNSFNTIPLQDPLSSALTHPLSADGIVGTGVVPLYKSVFLQRLADPLRDYHPDTNPYITVDWSMLDLTVYTGEYAGSSYDEFEVPSQEHINAGYVRTMPGLYTDSESYNTKYISSRQWGVNGPFVSGSANNQTNQWARLLDWSKLPELSDGIKTNGSTHNINDTGFVAGVELDIAMADGTSGLDYLMNFPYQSQVKYRDNMAQSYFPKHTLGRLNTNPSLLTANGIAPASERMVFGQAIAQYKQAGFPEIVNANIYRYIGAPVMLSGDITVEPSQRAATMVNVTAPIWHNGPLANSLEVMQVPASAPGRFGVEFYDPGTLKSDKPPYDTNYLLESMIWDTEPNYVTNTLGVPRDEDGDGNVDLEDLPGSLGSNVRFGHLLNFQHSHGNWWPDWYAAFADLSLANPGPPPFVSLDLANALNFLNVPSRFAGTRDWHYEDRNDNGQWDTGEPWYSYSRFREPGKININTVTAPGFAALIENRPYNFDTSTFDEYEAFDNSRGFYDQITSAFLPFGQPFRSSSSASLNVGTPYNTPYESSVDATLMRNQKDLNLNTNTGVPMFAPPIDDVDNDYDADNTYTALEGIQRLSDMTTTRSNVFAVWLTLGYFEVEKIQPGDLIYDPPNPADRIYAPTDTDRFNAIYPDGYTLKKEVGLETGEIKRHRAFYIIDRSVPFGYRRGQKLNSEDAILLKRFIE